MDRRSFIVAGSALMASFVATDAYAQTVSVSAEDLGAVLADNQRFELMRLSVAALRLNLAVLSAVDNADTIGALNAASGQFFTMFDRIAATRSQLFEALKKDSSQIEFSAELNAGIMRIEARLAEGGIEPRSNLSNAFTTNLQFFLAAVSKTGENVDGWFCSTFPFSQFC